MQAFRRGRRAAGRIADEHALLGVAGIGVVVLSLNYSQPHTAGSPEGQRPRSHGSGGRHFGENHRVAMGKSVARSVVRVFNVTLDSSSCVLY